MPKDDINGRGLKYWLSIIGSMCVIAASVLAAVYFPVNMKFESQAGELVALREEIVKIDGKVEKVWEDHDRDCKMFLDENKNIRNEMGEKLGREEVKDLFEPIQKAVDEMKTDFKSFLKEDRAFKNELTRIRP